MKFTDDSSPHLPSDMKNKVVLIGILFSFGFVLNPQPRIVTEKFFPDVQANFKSPAFHKKHGFTKYHEMMEYLNKLKSEHSDIMQITFIGKSQKGKLIPMVILKSETPKIPHPVKVWLQGGLHGDEPASTEGLLNVLESIVLNPVLLQRLEIAFVPMANIDGYEKQIRYAANGLDLNRDQTKLMAQESVYLKQVFSDYHAEVAVDFHEFRPYRRDFAHYNRAGITSRFDVMFLYSGNLNVPEKLRYYTNDTFVGNARKALDTHGLNYHDYVTTDDYYGDIHFTQGSVQSRSSATSYALTNCVSSLIEVRGVGLGRTSFTRRVFCTFQVAMSYLNSAYDRVDELRDVLLLSRKDKSEIVLKSTRKVSEEKLKVIDLDTYEETEIAVTLRDGFQSKAQLKRRRPVAYAFDTTIKQNKILVQKLRVLGASLGPTDKEMKCTAEYFIPTSVVKHGALFEQIHRTDIETKTETKQITLPKGTMILYMDQPKSNLVAEVLEPEAPNSFISYSLLEAEINKPLSWFRIIEF